MYAMYGTNDFVNLTQTQNVTCLSIYTSLHQNACLRLQHGNVPELEHLLICENSSVISHTEQSYMTHIRNKIYVSIYVVCDIYAHMFMENTRCICVNLYDTHITCMKLGQKHICYCMRYI